MTAYLTEVSFATETDIQRIHEMALHIGMLTGMSWQDQYIFAARAIDLCVSPAAANGSRLVIDLHEKEGSQLFIRLTRTDTGQFIEKQISISPGQEDVLSFVDKWKSRKQLEENYHDLERITFAITHDLKNSVAKLKLCLTLMDMQALPASVVPYMEIIQRSANSLEHTLQGMNKVIALGHLSNEVICRLSPSQVFDQVIEEFSDQLNSSFASISANFTKVDEFVYIETYLRSIFSNLVSNAIKYATPGRTLQLVVTAHQEEEGIRLKFTDNGIGIDTGQHGNKLFRPFSRLSSQAEGSGIGLYLIKNMVERNGGSISVQSVPGQGTTFMLHLQPYELHD